MKREKSWRREDGFLLRPGKQEDAEAYYSQNYCPLDGEAARLTGCKTSFTREEGTQFFLHAVEAEDRYLFLLLSPEGRIVGETALTDIDTQLHSANFRMAIFQPGLRGKGLGTWAARTTRDFAFAELKLHRLELDVFSFNPRAERCYRKAGFRREGVRRDEKIGYKIREARLQRTPYMLVVGDQEAESGTISVRHRADGDLGSMGLESFVEKMRQEVASKEIK